MIKNLKEERQHILSLSIMLKNALVNAGFNTGNSTSHIIPVILEKEELAIRAKEKLLQKGIIVSCIRPPTVPPNSSRLRIALTAGHTEEDVKKLVTVLSNIYKGFMERHFIFCHGFGFDTSFWDKLAPYFADAKCSFPDLGYFGNETQMPATENDEIVIGIGHSLGLIKLMNFNKKFDYIVVLNSFVNFCGNAPDLHEKRKEELVLLKKHFVQNPFSLMKGFYNRCKVTWDISKLKKLNKDTALQDLESLSLGHELNSDMSMLIIGSEDDLIIPEEILKDNFTAYKNVKIEIMDQGRHGLGWLEADKIQKKIKNFINYAD